jgi:hypothetical protein
MIDPISPLVASAGLGSFIAHILTKSASKEERLRQAKIAVRLMIQKVEDESPGYLFTIHDELSTQLKQLVNVVIDDLSASRQKLLSEAATAFVEASDEDIRPKVSIHPFDRSFTKEEQAVEKTNWFRPQEFLKGKLVDVLNTL